MLKKIGTDTMRKKMGEILDCVNLRGDAFIIERKDKPIAGLIPIHKLIAIEQISKSYLMDFLQDSSTPLSDDEIANIADEAKHKTRKKRKSK
jgi:hypothetical protein